MLTLKTALILSRSSSLQGSLLGLLVHNDYPRMRCRERCHSGVYAAASIAAKPGMHGGRLISRGRGILVQERPDLVDQWDHELNGDMAPENVQAGSAYRATWRCSKCCGECGKPHVWQAMVKQRTKAKGSNCPVCSGHKVCSCQSLATLRPDVMLEWAEENSLDPQTLGCSSNQKALWTCSKNPKHGSWSGSIGHRAGPHASGCPRCANEALRGPRSARGLLKDEFPEVYTQIHPIPWSLGFLEGLTSGSSRKVWWRCLETQNRPPDCSHEHVWEAKVKQRCHHRSGCPFCSGRCVCPRKSIAEKASGMLAFWHFTEIWRSALSKWASTASESLGGGTSVQQPGKNMSGKPVFLLFPKHICKLTD